MTVINAANDPITLRDVPFNVRLPESFAAASQKAIDMLVDHLERID